MKKSNNLHLLFIALSDTVLNMRKYALVRLFFFLPHKNILEFVLVQYITSKVYTLIINKETRPGVTLASTNLFNFLMSY